MGEAIDITAILIAAVSALIPTGGILGIVTLRDKKTAAMLDNYDRVVKSWEETANDRKARADELKADLDAKDVKIDKLYDTIAHLRESLDKANTKEAVAELLRCEHVGCDKRQPPLRALIQPDTYCDGKCKTHEEL